MPMPIPKPLVLGDIDLHYMAFAEAHVIPFTDEHQPSLMKSNARIDVAPKRKEASIIASRLALSRVTNILTYVMKHKNRSNFKLAAATRVRGVVVCNTCFRPRCIYAQYEVVHMKPPLVHLKKTTNTPQRRRHRRKSNIGLLLRTCWLMQRILSSTCVVWLRSTRTTPALTYFSATPLLIVTHT